MASEKFHAFLVSVPTNQGLFDSASLQAVPAEVPALVLRGV
jgi:hypothetical protein